MDIVLLLTSIVFAGLVVLGAIYFLVYFQHPDDKWVAWLPKLIVVLGISVSCYNIFLLPLDVANQKGSITATGGLPMEQISLAFFITTICMGVVLVPFVMFYYEGVDDSDSEEDKSTTSAQIIYAFKWLIPTLIIFGVIDFLLWKYVGFVNINLASITGLLQQGDAVNLTFCNATECMYNTATEVIQVSPLISTVAFATVLGWALFSVFGGVGLVALPFDLLMEFKHRPRPIKTDVYLTRKKKLGEQAAILMEQAETLKSSQKELGKSTRKKFSKGARKLKGKESKFKRDVILLEQDYLYLEESHKNAHGRALLYISKAVIGLIGIFLSFFWVLHIILYMVPPIFNVRYISGFLNDFMTSVSSVPFLGVAFYALFSFWLMFCVIKGNTKLGMRILFLSIHPMKIKETFMSSFLFNVGLILFSSLAVAQFCTMAFEDYAKYTTSQTLFVATIRNLDKLRYYYDVLIFVLLGFVLLTTIYCGMRK